VFPTSYVDSQLTEVVVDRICLSSEVDVETGEERGYGGKADRKGVVVWGIWVIARRHGKCVLAL
jgi:hypothetical protein